MKPYLHDLLLRMQDDSYRPDQQKIEGVWESEKTVRSQAYNEARMLDDSSLLENLYELIEKADEDEKRRHALFIVGFIAKNTTDIFATEFLLKRLQKEKRTHTIILILDRLAELFKPDYFDLTVIKNLIDKKGLLIRRSAYYALTNSAHGMEDYLLNKLADTHMVDDLEGIIGALGYIGTKKSIIILKPFMKSRKFAIKHAVQNCLPTIMVREGFPITEICRTTKVSTDFVKYKLENISRLSRPA